MLAGFIFMCVLGALVICVTSLIAYEVLRVVWNRMPEMKIAPRARVLLIMLPIFMVHIGSIWIYAVIYFLIENFTNVGHLTGGISPAVLSWESFTDRLYYSASTYASLGLGDIVPAKNLRMLTSAEVLNGLVLIGWTISFTYLAMEKFWLSHRRDKER